MKVSTVMPGSRNAAISEVTDWGALKKVLLWGSSNISVGVEKSTTARWGSSRAVYRFAFYTASRIAGLAG